MKKIFFCLALASVAVSVSAATSAYSLSYPRNIRNAAPVASSQKSIDAVYQSASHDYQQGKLSADDIVELALYHKAAHPDLAAQLLKLTGSNGHPRSAAELGVIFAFTPEYAGRDADGVKLLEAAAKAGYKPANEYLGLYYFNHGDIDKAKACFDAAAPMEFGFGYTALGSMYLEGKGVREDGAKARENYRQAALKGYPRGAALYGFNLRTNNGGKLSYPDSFFWLYIAGDLGDDAARTTLYLSPRGEKRGNSETAKGALEALQWIAKVQTGKNIKNEPIYKDGFVPSLKEREKAAEAGDDWARFYLGSMNYNGEFLSQNYSRAIHYYEPIAANAKLPRAVLALVNERLAKMYREGHGTKANAEKAMQYARQAAKYGSLSAYQLVEGAIDK